ncbi:MAG TPA: MFS transporter [Micromonosporaceae bacterium]|nr:MFS transporter [Micromonosporaceae bacterium]
MSDPRLRVRLVLAFAGFILIGFAAGASGVLLPAQIAHYRLDKSVIGLLFFAFSAGYVLAGAVNGWLLRRAGTRTELLLGIATFGAAALGCALPPAYPGLLVLTLVLGFGAGIIDSGLNAYVASLPRHTARLNYLHAFYGVGALLGPVLAAALLDSGLPWNAVYLVFAAGSVPMLVGFGLGYPQATPPAADGPARPSAVAAAVRHRAIVLTALFLAVYVGVEASIGNWGYSLLVEERGQDALLAGWAVSGYWFGFTAGRFVVNTLAERAGIGPVALAFSCLAAVAAATALAWVAPADLVVVLALAALGFFLGPVFPLTIAVLPRLAPAWLVPTSIGLLIGVSVVGGAFFPWLAGTVAHHLGLGTLLPYTLLLAGLMLVSWWRIARRVAPA